MIDNDIEALRESRWFGDLAPGLGTRLSAVARIRRLSVGGFVYRQGDPPDGLYMVIDGVVRLKAFSEGGNASILLLARPGDWFGEASTLDGMPRQQDAACDAEALLLHVSLGDIERLGRVEPQFWRAIGILASLHQRAAIAHMQSMASMPGEGRVMALLRGLSGDRRGCPLAITHDEIAGTIGMSRQTVTSALRRLQRRGVVKLGYRSIILTGLPDTAFPPGAGQDLARDSGWRAM